MQNELIQYKKEVQEELQSILSYWMHHTLDEEKGGFFGKIDNHNIVHKEAPKGSVLNSRILWAFSSSYNFLQDQQYLSIADRAYDYLINQFLDKEYGGVYWSVDHEGKPLDTKKQIYALSFAVYGLSEYYQSRKLEAAKQYAIELYEAIVKYSYDKTYGGYIEALTREWEEMGDLRLSAKDANEKKSMNTHLHVLEGFTNLYRIWPDPLLKDRITELIHLFLDHIVDAQTHHLILFFDEQWNKKSDTISYGHDIEAAWLIQEAAEVIGDHRLLEKVKVRCVQIAEAAKKGLDNDGGLWYEYEPAQQHLVEEKHSWPQAEAMVGFLSAWENTGNEAYLQHSLNAWAFTKNHILDKEKGEWYWGVKKDYSPMNEDKAGFWKCPYHNSRACLEIMRRIHQIN
jgi:mannobiose 2-epimerase